MNGSCIFSQEAVLSQALPIISSPLLPFLHLAQAKILTHEQNHMFLFGIRQEEAWFYRSNKKDPSLKNSLASSVCIKVFGKCFK